MGGGASSKVSSSSRRDVDPRYTSKATTLLQAALEYVIGHFLCLFFNPPLFSIHSRIISNLCSCLSSNSFYGPLIPEADWVTFCALWKQERAQKPLILSNRICFVVTFGVVSATTAPSGGGEAITARTFRGGEMIHLFSNHDKIVKNADGEMTAMEFDGLKVAYALNKEAIVYGLDAAEYAVWIKDRPQLTSLSRFNHLKLSNIVHDSVYFMDIPHSRIDMIGPLLRLRRAKVNDVLFKVDHLSPHLSQLPSYSKNFPKSSDTHHSVNCILLH